MSDLQAMSERFLDDHYIHVRGAKASMATDLAALIRAAQAKALREAATRMRDRYQGGEVQPAAWAEHFASWLTRRADEVFRE